MVNLLNPYQQTQAFHEKFQPVKVNEPTAFSSSDASYRAGFKAEELVEFLAAASQNDEQVFQQLIADLQINITQAVDKTLTSKPLVENPLVEQVDALIDLLYFTYGSFVLMGVDPTEIFNLVHQANMGKLFPDGQPHYHPKTGKVLKPENWESEFAPEPRILTEIKKQQKQAREGR